MNIRIRQTGAVIYEGEFRSLFPNTSLPQQLTETIINDLGGDVVFEGPQATDGEFWQYSQQAGVEQKNGKWYTKYVLGPIFTDTEERDAYIALKTTERNTAIQNAIVEGVQKRLDDFAKTRNYYDILSAATYANSTNPTFAAEALYCVQKRDETWAKVYQIEKDIKDGKRSMPSGYADIEAELPSLSWSSILP
jgi:hypothetical protein